MPKFRKKPVVIEATQWRAPGDHEAVTKNPIPAKYQFDRCSSCRQEMGNHGWISTLEGGHNVCPEDWIITGVAGEQYPCKPHIFCRDL